MERANSQLATPEEQRGSNERTFQDALTRWRNTGIIPIEETRE
jgi:hypothetical protein